MAGFEPRRSAGIRAACHAVRLEWWARSLGHGFGICWGTSAERQTVASPALSLPLADASCNRTAVASTGDSGLQRAANVGRPVRNWSADSRCVISSGDLPKLHAGKREAVVRWQEFFLAERIVSDGDYCPGAVALLRSAVRQETARQATCGDQLTRVREPTVGEGVSMKFDSEF